MIALLPIFIIIFIMLIVVMYASGKLNDKPETGKMNLSAEELLRYKTIDEMVRKLQNVADSGEVNYFSMDDIRKVADEMKGIK